MVEPSRAVLRVAPHQISALRVAFHSAYVAIGYQLARLRQEAQIAEPWFRDLAFQAEQPELIRHL